MKIKISNEIEYNIEIGYQNSISILEEQLQNKSYFLCIDSRVYLFFEEYLKPLIDNAEDIIIIEANENNKSQQTVNQIHEMLFAKEASRSSYLIAIGGGIIGDVVGLAAALYMRGLNYIQVPTTLLAQVDSSIGNKVAINANKTKNSIGTFYAPTKVVIDLFFLEKLTTRIFKEGLVELIKHGLIQDDTIINDLTSYQNIMELRNDKDMMKKLITKSLQVKKDIVQQDPLDKHLRHVLNLGHTFAHALEMSDNNDYYHGEAVAIGLLVSAKLSGNINLFKTIENILMKFECVRSLSDVDLNKIFYDKKRINNKIKEVYLKDLNSCEIKEVAIDILLNDFEIAYQDLKENIKSFNSCFEFKSVNLSGNVTIPPSKSQLHRYLIAAALSNETTVLTNVTSIYDDINVTMDALVAFGMSAIYDKINDKIIIKPLINNEFNNHVHMKESGTSLRLLLPLLLNGDNILITGDNKLPSRPLDIFFDIFTKQNISYKRLSEHNLPLEIAGELKGGIFELKGNVSSQFISGLLFALPLLKEDSKLVITTKLESLPYVQMSLETLADFGILIEHNDDYTEFYIKGQQKYISKKEYSIEQDYSSRCFFEVAKSFKQHNIIINNPIATTKQGDSIVIDVVKDKLKTLDLSDVPDVAPIMAIYYAINGGTLTNTQRLQYKESNRLQAVCDFLNIMNIDYLNKDDKLIIKPGIIHGGKMNTHDDHRITMAIIIASTISHEPIIISEVKSINKSFSTFLEIYEKLGGFVDEK